MCVCSKKTHYLGIDQHNLLKPNMFALTFASTITPITIACPRTSTGALWPWPAKSSASSRGAHVMSNHEPASISIKTSSVSIRARALSLADTVRAEVNNLNLFPSRGHLIGLTHTRCAQTLHIFANTTRQSHTKSVFIEIYQSMGPMSKTRGHDRVVSQKRGDARMGNLVHYKLH